MAGKVIGIAPNIGFPGTFSRNGAFYVMARQVKTTGFNPGDAVVINTDNTVTKFGAAGTLALFGGFAVREVKQYTGTYTGTQGNMSYAVGDMADVLSMGTIAVKVTRGTPTAGGKVYIRTVLGSPADSGAVVGGIEAAAAADGGTTIELTNCKFKTGTQDANGTTEVDVLIRNQA